MSAIKSTIDSKSWIKWLILLLAVASYLMGFIARFAWPPVIPLAVPDLGIDMTRAGLYMSAFYIGYVVTHIPAGFLADRFGVRYLIVAAMLFEGISSIGLAMTDSFSVGFALRIATGLGAGTIYASCVRLISSWFEPKERGLAFGLLMISPSAGVLVSNQLATAVLKRFEWQTLFLIVGSLALVLSIVTFFGVNDSKSEPNNRKFSEGIKYIFSNRDVLRIALAGFCLMWVQVGFVSWGNTAIQGVGYSLAKAGFAMTLFGIGGIVGPLISGYLIGRSDNKKWLMISGFILLVPFQFIFGQFEGYGYLVILALIIGLLNGYLNTFMPLMVTEYSDPKWSALAGGVSGSIFQIGAVFGPAVLGMSIDQSGSFDTAWYLLAAAPILGAMFLLTLSRPVNHPV